MFKKLFKRKDTPQMPTAFEYCGELFPQSPRVKLLTNDKLSVILTDVGGSYIKSKTGDVTKNSSDLLTNPKGSFCFVKFGNEVFSTSFSPFYRENVQYETAFLQNGAAYFAREEGVKLETWVFLDEKLGCEQRELIIENKTKSNGKITLLFYFEPNVEKSSNVSYDHKTETLTVSKNQGDEYDCIGFGFREKIPFEYTTNSDFLFENYDIAAVKSSAFTAEFLTENQSCSSCICIKTELSLSKNERKSICIITAVGGSTERTISDIMVMREKEKLNEETACKSEFRKSSIEHRIIQAMLPQFLYNKRDSGTNLNAIKENHLHKSSLAELGISTDLPIAVVEIFSKLDTERAEVYLKCHSHLKKGFIEFQSVFLYDGDSETLAMLEAASVKSGINSKEQEKNGIIIIDKQTLSTELETLILAAASHIATRSLVRIEAVSQGYSPIKPIPCNTAKIAESNESDQPEIKSINNDKMTAYFTEKAMGFTELCKPEKLMLTAKSKDNQPKNSPEQLIVKLNEEYYDIINGSTLEIGENFAIYHSLADEIKITTVITLERDKALKKITLELNNTSYEEKSVEICYYTNPVMGEKPENSRELCGEIVESMIILTNEFNIKTPAFMGFTAHQSDFRACFDRSLFLCGRWDTTSTLPQNDNCVAIAVSKKIPSQKCQTVNFSMAYADTQNQLKELLKV